MAAWNKYFTIGASVWDPTIGLDGMQYCWIRPLFAYCGCSVIGLLDELIIWKRELSATGLKPL
jgi:hypothetical protein